MARQQRNLDPIGLSAIDLLCCAFVAIFILNLQLEDVAGETSSRQPRVPVSAVFVDLEAGSNQPPALALGVRLVLGDESVWSTGAGRPGEITWASTPNRVVAFINREIPAGSSIDVFLLESTEAPSVRVRVSSTSGGGRTGELRASEFYRARFDWP